MSKSVALLLGTKRGVFVASKTPAARKWSVRGPLLAGSPVYCAAAASIRQNGKLLLAGINSMHWGPSIQRSRDNGKTWMPAKVEPRFGPTAEKAVDAVWQIVPAGPDYPGSFYAGVAPAALFRSDDYGETWTEVKSLSEHPTRKEWQPGNGGLCLHSILVDPANSDHLLVGISAVGVFESYDRGKNWTLINQGLGSVFHPDETGGPNSCVHKIAFAAGGKRIYQQNHIGAFKRDGQGPWVSINSNLPSNFGFPLVAHPRDPDSAYVIPLESGEFRAPKKGALVVYRTVDSGKSWKPLNKGLPTDAYMNVLRDGMAIDRGDPCGIYFGTSAGQLYASRNEGKTWSLVADLLPPIYSVRVVNG